VEGYRYFYLKSKEWYWRFFLVEKRMERRQVI